jgi:UDP-N-acetylmuramate--alanine ligase
MTVCSNIFNGLKHIHFIGIGGAGTAPLAKIMLQRGYSVSGSDLCLNQKTQELEKMGARIFEEHSTDNLPAETQLLVYSSAAAIDNPELVSAGERQIPCLRRGDFLAKLASTYYRTIAVSGSHGKTTITAMLAWILRNNQIPCGYLVGGKVNGFPEAEAGDGDIFLTEVDESDGTHALFSPFIGVVSNVEDDHSWSVGGTETLMNNFSTFAAQSKELIYISDSNSTRLFENHTKTLSLDNASLLECQEIKFNGFMKINAALACFVAEKLGINFDDAVNSVNNFPGVDRRMTIHYSSPAITLIEDYAHHPTEVARAVELLRKNYPGYHLRVIFQPHRYARLEKYIGEFARELAVADSVFIVPVFAAWTEHGKVDSGDLAELTGDKAVNLNMEWPEMPPVILRELPGKLLLAVFGAGDIEKLIPEIKLYLKDFGE